MGAVTSIVRTQVVPSIEQKVWFYRYSKAGATDTLDASGEFTLVRGVFAKSAAGATNDTGEVSSSTTITFASGTGGSYCLVVGDGS